VTLDGAAYEARYNFPRSPQGKRVEQRATHREAHARRQGKVDEEIGRVQVELNGRDSTVLKISPDTYGVGIGVFRSIVE
jgi:hypothetical protein